VIDSFHALNTQNIEQGSVSPIMDTEGTVISRGSGFELKPGI
jgi:hypothetical protein